MLNCYCYIAILETKFSVGARKHVFGVTKHSKSGQLELTLYARRTGRPELGIEELIHIFWSCTPGSGVKCPPSLLRKMSQNFVSFFFRVCVCVCVCV